MQSLTWHHTGFVAPDLDAACAELRQIYGCEWSAPQRRSIRLAPNDMHRSVDLLFRFSQPYGRIEVIEAVPGTLWEESGQLAVHHHAYWSQDIELDATRLRRLGFEMVLSGQPDDVTQRLAYCYMANAASQTRFELMAEFNRSILERNWS